jgi:hypothetical protein
MAVNPKSIENLKQGKRFGSGQPTDRGGAPAGKRLSTYLKEIGELEFTMNDLQGNSSSMPAAKAAALVLFTKAIKDKEIKAIELLFKYLEDDGKNKVEVSKDNDFNMSPAMIDVLTRAGVYKVLKGDEYDVPV